MAWYIKTWEDRYPRTIAFLQEDLRSLSIGSQKIFDSFVANARLDTNRARDVLKFSLGNGTPPLIWFTELGALSGLFQRAYAGRISINAEVARRFELTSTDDAARAYVQAKVLHEMVHWSLYDQGDLEPSGIEMGERFEAQAFGAPLAPFWLGIGHAALSSGAPDHGRIEITNGSTNFTNDHLTAGLPRGIRCNNPGNIKRSQAAWEGLAEPSEMKEFQRWESVFCVFREPHWGLRAMARTLFTYQRQHQLHTIGGMIERWAPPDDNNATASYISFVSQRTSLARNQVFNFGDPAYALPMLEAMIKMENGMQPYSRNQIERAHAAAD